jgi:hypothetical protein
MNNKATVTVKADQETSMTKTILQSGLKAAGFSFAFALLVTLFVAWIFSTPVYHLKRKASRGLKKHRYWQKQKRHFGGQRLGRNGIFKIISIGTLLWSAATQAQYLSSSASENAAVQLSKPVSSDVWQNGLGNGFKAGAQSVSLGLGAGYGVEILGSRQSHDLALVSISYGYMVGSVKGEGYWYQGNWELRGELFSGAQFSPTSEWLVGLTPHLRYNFATGTRWIPYMDIGAGVSATSIGPPDLSHYFEFNLQAATGLRYFILDNVALGIEARYFHLSCAGLSSPNLGLNNVGGMFSISWFF